MFDLNDLAYFVKVVDHGGFAAAGRAAGIPKSKLSRRVGELEAKEISLARILTGIALDFYDLRIGDDWRSSHPKLAAWHATIAARPSFQATRPA